MSSIEIYFRANFFMGISNFSHVGSKNRTLLGTVRLEPNFNLEGVFDKDFAFFMSFPQFLKIVILF